MTTHACPGLHVGPMGAWLSAVGLLRAVNQADPAATLHWTGNVPVLSTAIADIPAWLTDELVHAPVVTPWQAGGGWGDNDKTAARRLQLLRESTSPRLARLRAAVVAADLVLARRTAGWDKPRLVRELRNWAPDDAVAWFDVAVPLTDDGKPVIGSAPLVGTHGNDGRWDASTNYHAAVLAVHTAGRPQPAADLLDGTAHERVVEMSAGPYWPGAAGLLNPWAMILVVWGLLAFGDGRLRVHGDTRQPWTAVRQPRSSDQPCREESSWGEAWLPMWDEPVGMPEVTTLLGGPWPRWGDAHRALIYEAFAAGAVPAGVTRCARYGLLQRKGRNHIAVPLATVAQPGSQEPEWLDETDAHKRAGVRQLPTWRAYVARGQAPGPDRLVPSKAWLATTIETYRATRPGPGIRTDLR